MFFRKKRKDFEKSFASKEMNHQKFFNQNQKEIEKGLREIEKSKQIFEKKWDFIQRK